MKRVHEMYLANVHSKWIVTEKSENTGVIPTLT